MLIKRSEVINQTFALKDINPTDKLLLFHIACHIPQNRHYVFDPQALAQLFGMSVDSVNRYKRNLIRQGYLEKRTGSRLKLCLDKFIHTHVEGQSHVLID